MEYASLIFILIGMFLLVLSFVLLTLVIIKMLGLIRFQISEETSVLGKINFYLTGIFIDPVSIDFSKLKVSALSFCITLVIFILIAITQYLGI